MFWQILWYILAFVLGWYLYPFDSRVRNGVNAVIMRIVRGVIAMIQEKQSGTPQKRTTARASTASNRNGRAAKLKPVAACPNCHNPLELIEDDPRYKNYNWCATCRQMFATK